MPNVALFQPLFRTGQMRQPPALDATQDHAFIDSIVIFGQTERAVDAVNAVTGSDAVERQILHTSPYVCGKGKDRWLRW